MYCHVHKCNTRFLTVRNEEVAGKAPLSHLLKKATIEHIGDGVRWHGL
jgi:hypothetical protein